MAFENEIALCMEQIRELETILQTATGKLNDLKQHLQAIEKAQHPEEEKKTPLPETEEHVKKEFPFPVFLGDKLTKTMYTDLKKSLSLNDRFRFLRNLFENNAGLMDKTLDDLNTFSSLQETLDYLNSRFSWDWGNEQAAAFKEILEKRFV
jgi:hypothetical protein